MSKFLVRSRRCQREPPSVQPKYDRAYKGEQKQPALGITAYPLQDSCLEGGPFVAGFCGWSGGRCWKKGRGQPGCSSALRRRRRGSSAPPKVLLPGPSRESSLASKRKACQNLAAMGSRLAPARCSQAARLQTGHGATPRADPSATLMMVEEGVRWVERLLAEPHGAWTRKAAP